MTSTEQKNVTQPFIDSCFNYGIYPTLIANATTHPSIETESIPFSGLGPTKNIGERIRRSKDPLSDARLIMPVLNSAPVFTRLSPFILKLVERKRVLSGNQGVLAFCDGILSGRWNLHFSTTNAVKHARRHAPRVCAMLAPGAYGAVARTERNVRRLCGSKAAAFCRNASDVIDLLARQPRHGRHAAAVRKWCAHSRGALDYRTVYRRAADGLLHYNSISRDAISTLEDPPHLSQKHITSTKKNTFQIKVYHICTHYYICISRKEGTTGSSRLTEYDDRKKRHIPPKDSKWSDELYIFSGRDMSDLAFLLHSCSNIHMYNHRRLHDVRRPGDRHKLKLIQDALWSLYLSVMRKCGSNYELRNKLGVYFDVLQWRYLAWKSGDVFYNHSQIMGNKIQTKGLESLPTQDDILSVLKKCPMDQAVDMLGLYKSSIYPEVDPYAVVCDQYRLHMARHKTDWEPDSAEGVRFEETRSYMWYLGIRLLKGRFGTWPGRIRDGVEVKPWHSRYKVEGIPGSSWRDGCDVDLTGAVVVTDITNEQYMKQQDSACAPPFQHEFANYESLRKAPRRHRRKLLYAVQEPELPDLEGIMRDLNRIGGGLGRGHIAPITYNPNFTTDIVTGSRCERHKDAPRPFYAASSPWGCILSYIDGITRDFLHHVPQSMLGKSTRQKFLDLSTTCQTTGAMGYTFYMSDDKAKYSPHMDPNSQQLPAEFFAEVFNIPAIKAVGPVMYHNELYYRVNGHLVHYNSNGTDREGMRGASNTWLEVVAQGLSTRLCREKGLIRGRSTFLSFIDDGLRKFSVDTTHRNDGECYDAARLVIDDVIFGLKVLGRELSWDKTFISRDLFVILNELVYDGSFISSGLKSFCTSGDLEMKEVMSAPDYEQLFFGKMRGSHGVGTPIDICHFKYVFETLLHHFRMGASLQNNKDMNDYEYRLFCITPVALGGAGLRSQLQMSCNEVANATKEGIGNMSRLGQEYPFLMGCVENLLNQPFEPLSPVDFMREPEQFHVYSPRLKTQRLAAEVRKHLRSIAQNDMSRKYIEQDRLGMEVLSNLGRTLMLTGDVSAEEIRLLYATTPVAFVDEFIQKLASSTTLSELLSKSVIANIRRMVRNDLIHTMSEFRHRCGSMEMIKAVFSDLSYVAMMSDIIA